MTSVIKSQTVYIGKTLCTINEVPSGQTRYTLNEPITNWSLIAIKYRTHKTGIMYQTFIFPKLDSGFGIDCPSSGLNAYGGFENSQTFFVKGTVGTGYPYIETITGIFRA